MNIELTQTQTETIISFFDWMLKEYEPKYDTFEENILLWVDTNDFDCFNKHLGWTAKFRVSNTFSITSIQTEYEMIIRNNQQGIDDHTMFTLEVDFNPLKLEYSSNLTSMISYDQIARFLVLLKITDVSQESLSEIFKLGSRPDVEHDLSFFEYNNLKE